MWNQSFQFDIHVPELVMVRFVVEDYDSTSQNDLIGQYSLPLTSIQNGTKNRTDYIQICAPGWISDVSCNLSYLHGRGANKINRP